MEDEGLNHSLEPVEAESLEAAKAAALEKYGGGYFKAGDFLVQPVAYTLRYGHYHLPVFESHETLKAAVLSGLAISETGEGYPESITDPEGKVLWARDYPCSENSLEHFAEQNAISFDS